MDKLITIDILAAIVFLFYTLHSMSGHHMEMQHGHMEQPASHSTGAWEAIVGMGAAAHSAGHYHSYTECIRDVRNKVDVRVTPYSCSRR